MELEWIDLGSWYLALTRGLLSAYCVGTITVLAMSLAGRTRKLYVRRSTLFFALWWHIVLASIAIPLFLTEFEVSSTFLRATYGAAFLGSLVGLGWMLLDWSKYHNTCPYHCKRDEDVKVALRVVAEELADKK